MQKSPLYHYDRAGDKAHIRADAGRKELPLHLLRHKGKQVILPRADLFIQAAVIFN